MLKAMCRIPPCRNIEVNTVTHHGGESRGAKPGRPRAARYSAVPWQTTCSDPDALAPPPTWPTAQSLRGCVSRYGIAPYRSVVSSRCETPAICGEVLEPGSEDSVACQTKTAMLIAIRTTVTTGNRSVGMLSLTGIRAGYP